MITPPLPKGKMRVVQPSGDTLEMDFSRDYAKHVCKEGYLDFVTLTYEDGRPDLVMAVDDNGLAKGLPLNLVGTELYRSVCKPEYRSHCVIVGPIVLLHDGDCAGE